jgi:hypothetical protein
MSEITLGREVEARDKTTGARTVHRRPAPQRIRQNADVRRESGR